MLQCFILTITFYFVDLVFFLLFLDYSLCNCISGSCQFSLQLSKWRVLLLNLLLCLNGPLFFCHQLDCLESTVPRLEKRVEVPLLKLSACILRPITHIAILCNLFQVQGSCLVKDFSPQLKTSVSDPSFD